MAYLETSRGCPLRCAYCRYPHLRRRLSFLPLPRILETIATLRRRGAREIRFVDPTFNVRPDFDRIVAALAASNRSRRLKFFAELKAEDLSRTAPARLAAAGFAEIEVGLQTTNPAVLKNIRRPTRLPQLNQGVRRLERAGVKVTLDLMYGLPGQSLSDVRRDLRAAFKLKNVRIQCLQTLLLPGTELRRRRAELGLSAINLPPYGVIATPSCPAPHLRRIEELLTDHPRLGFDSPTRRFVGRMLPDLFADRVRIDLDRSPLPARRAGGAIRQAVILEGAQLYPRRAELADWIGAQVRLDPHALWQFVLALETEEPLDLLDALIRAVRCVPRQVTDRYAACLLTDKLAARRIFIRLAPRRRYSRSWVLAAESLLRAHFA
jgi:hypothetical protein